MSIGGHDKKTSQSCFYLPSQYLTNSNIISLNFNQFCYHPCQIAKFIIHSPQNNGYNKIKLLKWISFAAFCHPVVVPYAQNTVEKIIGNKNVFQVGKEGEVGKYGQNLIALLQAINVFCLVKGFSLQLLKIQSSPQIHSSLEYANALWRNCLPFLTKYQLHSFCKNLISQIPKQPTCELKVFINQLNIIKKKVTSALIENNYFQDNYRNMGQFSKQQCNIHSIDIQLSKYNCLVSAEFLPDDYQGQYIQIWVNRTVELNSLLGNFVCKEKFGQFQYVKGPLMYAMEKGIMLVLNNFQHISNELLIGMRTLAQQNKIFHNQKTLQARGGFKILGLCSPQRMSTKMKSMVMNNQYIAHLDLPKRSVIKQIPKIDNQTNREFVIQKLKYIQQKFGLLASRKLWKRMYRLRKLLLQSQDNNKLWQSFFTQGFKDSVELEIMDLMSITDQTRTIHYQQKYNKIIIGRVVIDKLKQPSQKIVKTQYSLSILQRLSLCSDLSQTPLLISQTGCGKTTLVQYLAQLGGHHLYVYNMSSGTDVMDLIGGFKPIDCRSLLKQLFFRFIQKFRLIPGSQKNQQYLQELLRLYNEDQLKRLLPSLSASIVKIKSKVQQQKQLRQWDQLKNKFDNIYANLGKIDSNLVFSFLQGNLIKALKNGDWVLIDEINMATNDVLQKIIPLIQGKSLLLYEKGDLSYIERHKDFRIIACMNPANDSGKKPLPPNLMQKFTAINLPQPLRMDVEMMIKQIASQLNPSQIADIYFSVKKQKTVSLRNLARCLSYLNRNKQIYTFKRALYDALLLGFQQKQLLKFYEDLTIPKIIPGFMEIQGFLVETGTHKHGGQPEIFHLTTTFLEHLKDFLRAIAGTQLPVLLQGPTSAGKTSIIRYVASLSCHNCIRINNHEHTQIEQYLGNYFPDKQGKLIFREGPLVQAVRQGHWLILDQLNLARTQILQCLNRLLDDNRQLFIPQQQIHIKPHKNFRIFATQNPASYSGRKVLSRAFRNRFISLSFDDITIDDTMAIMKVRRPILNDSKQLSVYVKRTLQSLQNYRQKQRVFSKDSVITIRDLLKWTGRQFNDKQSFMREGYALLVQRLRTQEQKKFVQEVLLFGTKIQKFNMFQQYEKVVNKHLNESIIRQSNIYVQMNKSFKRMAALTLKAVLNNQAVLLVGQTGCGKTTLAQLLASISGRKFYSINCHKHTQASDLLGCLRPCVKPNSINKFQYVNGVVIDAMLEGAVLLIDQINTAQDSVLERLNQVLQSNNIGVQRGQGWQTVTAKQGFCIIATMNPSGDYGKKQLSPALRNRFTEIWVEPITHPEYIQEAQLDIKQMIKHKLSKTIQQVANNKQEAANKIYNFIKDYNCIMAPKYGLTRKLLTMRDIGWVCKFMCQCQSQQLKGWESRYYWAVRILAVQGVNFMMGDLADSFKLSSLKQQLIQYINNQVSCKVHSKDSINNQIQAISIVKQLTFPLLIKTDLPIELLGIYPDQRIFFSPHTQLSDLLGQFRPKGNQFIWKDQTLLKSVKNGQRIALMDLNLAQQPVIEGINSLFDHRGSIFVVQLNQMFIKQNKFRPVVVLKQTAGSDRRGLPNSFLNRFIKIRVKDVSNDVKMKYLKKKYAQNNQYINYDELWSYITKVLMQNPKTKIQSLEYVCQLYKKDKNYLTKSSTILNLPSPILNSKIFQSLPAQQNILQILPLTSKYTLQSSTKTYKINEIQCLINSYITLTCSKFSICLIGNVAARQNMVHWIGYMLNKNVVKVMLSTMTDMADLLGSYQQVQDGQQQQQNQQITQMQQQQNLSTSNSQSKISKYLNKTIKKYIQSKQPHNPNHIPSNQQQNKNNTSSSTLSNFKYIQSQIIKTLRKSDNNILYIEVPNQSMLQRVQKGIKSIYQQNVSIIVGVDNTNSTLIINNTKFIPIHVDISQNTIIQLEPTSQSQQQQQSTKYFIPNSTNLTHNDKIIRLDQTQNWIQNNCKQQSNRNIIKAWQRLYTNIKTNKLSYSYIYDQLYIANKIKQMELILWGYLGLDRQYKDTINSMSNNIAQIDKQQYKLIGKQYMIVPSSKIQYQVIEQIIKLFSQQMLTSNHAILRNNIDLQSENQQNNQQQQQQNNNNNNGSVGGDVYNCTLAHKFQYLYLCDNGTFKQYSLKLLTLCYNNIIHATDPQTISTYKKTLHKLQQQIQSLYKNSLSEYSQILINYSSQQYKLIPILKPNRQSLFHYAFTNIPWSVNKLAGLQVDLSVIVNSVIQKNIVRYMGYVQVNSKQVADWIWRVNVRQLAVLDIIEKKIIGDKFDYYYHVASEIVNYIVDNTKLFQIITNISQLKYKQQLQLKYQTPVQFAYILFNSFKPSSSSYLNLLPHIKTQSQLKTLLALAQQDKFYLQVYQKLCLIKYNGYQPNSFKNIKVKITQYQKQYEEIIAKEYVYRGYDNLKMLKQFYQELAKYCNQIQNSEFQDSVVKRVMSQLYKGYYDNFKDILWPILASLIIIQSTQLVQKSYSFTSHPSLIQSFLSYNNSHKSFQKALDLILHKQQQQYNDAAKNYLKFQRKFKNTVIVDQYTEQGVNKNKQNQQEQFKEFFGKSEVQKPETILDQLYMLIRKRVGCKYELKLLKTIFNQCSQYYQFVTAFQLKFSSSKHIKSQKLSSKTAINIYQQYSLSLVNKLCTPIPKILEQTKTLLSKYNIDSVKIVGTLCNKIQQHKAHDEVYKILVDCQFLIQKIYELYPVLPMSQRIPTEQLESLCISVRKIQLQNWKSMLEYKISRVQKSDTIDFIHFYRNFMQIGNIGENQSMQGKQCFKMCDDFMRQSKISCYQYRLYLLTLVSQNLDSSKPFIKHNMNRIINFYSSLRQPIMQHWEKIKKQKIKQMSQYQKLTKWDSNNFLIFKQTCQRFQKKIHRILKRYQEQLAMQVGVFHTNMRNKHICQSIQDFSNIYKMKEQSERIFNQITHIQQPEQQKINNFEGVVQRIFETLEQIKQQHHNTQSKMLLIRNNLADLQQLSQTLQKLAPNNNNLISQIIVQEMFPDQHPEYYTKAVKYYFGMWDKLCQKTQTAWNRQVVQRMWTVAQKIWVNVNSRIPKYAIEIQTQIDEETDNILILFDKFINQQEQMLVNHHPIFTTQLTKIKDILRQKQSKFHQNLSKKYSKIQNPEQTICLMKIGYLIASIALNLQKNGLCVKQNQQEEEQSGKQQVGDGVGIGQGEAHQGAENVGDQIQFQQQLQGNKDQQKNKDANANKKQQNDIQMEGDFEGDMYSKQQQQQNDDQGKSAQQKQPQQQMGEVDNQQRQKDMKNDKGRAEGDQQADVQIDGQQQGSQQLVDNQQQQKQARKGQNREEQSEGQQQQKSDWDDNNQQGQKINKQQAAQMQQQEQNEEHGSDQSLSSVDHQGEQKISGQEDNNESGQQMQDENQQVSNKENGMEDEEQIDEQGNVQRQQLEQEINEQAEPEGEPEKQKQKKFKKTRRTNIEAFGRQDMNSNNPLKNNEMEAENQQKMNNDGAAQAAGANQGQKGSGQPVHSLSAQLLKQIQNLQRVTAKQNASFMKDLNVVAHDENNQQIQQANQQQQYQLTQQQNKLSTNLPAFLDNDKKQQKQQQNKKQEQQKKQRKQQKQIKKQVADKDKQTNKSKLEKAKNTETKQQIKQQNDQQLGKQQGSTKKQDKQKNTNKQDKKTINKQPKVLQVSQEQYLKSIVNANKNISRDVKKQNMEDQNQETEANVLEQAFQISKILQQQLKSVLEPMDNAEYRGDYKTGKKLNLKKIIPFIASNYRKDKIWLRRTEPSQRNYYVMLALDDTKSMHHGGVGIQALKGLLAISYALQHLSIKTCITGIRDSMNIYKNFQGLLQPDKIIKNFNFTHESSVSHDLSIASFMQASLEQFGRSQSCQTGVENKQLCFIISDGKMNKDYVRPYLRQAKKKDIIYVFIIVDSQKASILTTKSVSIDQNGKVKMKLYMSDFPFEYFLIVRNVRQLGDVLATTLLQFIQQK